MFKKNSLYLQVAEDIINSINKKEYLPGEKIPTEKELTEKFSVSRFTIREALNYLEKNDYIYKKHGIGTFVKQSAFTQKLFKFYSFSEEMKKIGKKPSTKIISFKKDRLTDPNLMSILDLEENSIIIIVERLRLADDEIVMYEKTYLPQKYFFDLEESHFENKNMYDVFRESYGIIFSGAKEKFMAVIPDKKIQEKLKMKQIEACMKIERRTFMNTKIVEYTISYAKSDKMTFEVDLNG